MDDPASAPGVTVREVTLPGVGKKYVMTLRGGGDLAVVVRPDGERQLHHFLEHEDRPCDVVKVDAEEAQQLANLLGRPVVQAPRGEDLELVLGALEIDWVTLGEGSPLAGSTLGESRLRQETGASVIAILRDGRAIANPDVDTPFQAGDTLLLIGSPSQTDAARALIAG
ncbi:MAG: TrkA C-terminal domain-containing protein [Deinococcales bacterium]|jgi:TrkA domain protein